MKIILLALLFVTIISFANTSTRSIVSPRSASLGSSINGNMGLNETILDNPASIGFTKDYTVEGFFTNNTKEQSKIFNISVVDSTTSSAAGGFSYSAVNQETSANYDYFYANMADRYFETLAFGLGGHYLKKRDTQKNSKAYDVDLGMLWAPSEHFAAGLTYRNIRRVDAELAPSEVTLGLQSALSYFYPTFNVTKRISRSNWRDKNSLIYASGLELMLSGTYFARAGYNYDTIEKNKKWALGAGWRAPKISFDYAFERGLTDKSEYQHILATRVYF